MAFLDLDEFLVLKDGSTNIVEFMKPYQNFGGLVVHWRLFGTSNLVQRPIAGEYIVGVSGCRYFP